MDLFEALFKSLDAIDIFLKVGTRLTHFYQSGIIRVIKQL